MKRVVYLAVAALVAMLMLVPTAMAQEQTVMIEQTVQKDLPSERRRGARVVGPACYRPAYRRGRAWVRRSAAQVV
jgi:hypothetical protein